MMILKKLFLIKSKNQEKFLDDLCMKAVNEKHSVRL